jgi:ribosomal protein S18 acetylase RimI-like enzyme
VQSKGHGRDPSAVVVRDASDPDAPAISQIGQVTVPLTYRGLCDESVILGIVEQSYAVVALQECIRACRLADDAHFLVAESGGRVVGFLHYDQAGPEPELHRIYVDPRHQRQAIGGALLGELHSRLRAGASYVLMVIAGNRSAVAFYRRHGFVDHAQVDGPTYMHDRMGVEFPAGTGPAPALVLRFTR